MNQELVKIVKDSGLEETQSNIILDKFTSFFQEISGLEKKAMDIVITDESQVEDMAKARESRLRLKEIRVNAEKTRKELKERSVREGKAIDGVANVIKALVIPIEEHLEKQEKFVENLEAERKARIVAERSLELMKYLETEEDLTLYNFKDMTDEVFNKLVQTIKIAYEAEQTAIKQAEADRIKNEKKEKADQEKMKKENEKLKKEADKKEKEFEIEREKQEKKLKAERLKAKKAADAKEKLENEIKDKEEAELKDKEDREEAERKIRMAPEKEKLIIWSEKIKSIESPADLSKAGLKIVKEAEEELLEVSQDIKLKIKNL